MGREHLAINRVAMKINPLVTDENRHRAAFALGKLFLRLIVNPCPKRRLQEHLAEELGVNVTVAGKVLDDLFTSRFIEESSGKGAETEVQFVTCRTDVGVTFLFEVLDALK